ncbi:MAG: hypothetical protein IPN69_00125 [Acidobacteria bacterium]|nr:hypothetical protein [Acidobacteriota bacterium]MBK8149928.1 hypothetical protein [Acidobacteriota bacterium]MBK8809128.1 hypothetical protein [Acidobacteriota bacterium]
MACNLELSKTRSDPGRFGPTVFAILLAVCAVAVVPQIAFAQDDDFPEFRPTPKIELSKDEKTTLDGQPDVKKYLRAALDLMDARIKAAEAQNEAGDFDQMLENLGGFHALIDATLEHLNKIEARRGKVLDTFKKYEIALRGFTPRIENIRREAPDRYGAYVLKLLKRVRDNRSRAIEPFFGDSVITERKPI